MSSSSSCSHVSPSNVDEAEELDRRIAIAAHRLGERWLAIDERMAAEIARAHQRAEAQRWYPFRLHFAIRRIRARAVDLRQRARLQYKEIVRALRNNLPLPEGNNGEPVVIDLTND